MNRSSASGAPRRLRARARYVALAAGTIVLGLTVHFGGAGLAPAARDVLGDALWAAMIAWWVAAAAPSAGISARSAAALAVCYAVELSQLYHAPGIDAVRDTTLGHLVLGSDFDARDLAAYAAGVLAATLLDHVAAVRRAGGRRTGVG